MNYSLHSLEVLAEDGPDLAVYAAAFEEAAIDLSLAEDMDVDNLRALLPQAPLGHCLRLRRIFQIAATPAPAILRTPVNNFK